MAIKPHTISIPATKMHDKMCMMLCMITSFGIQLFCVIQMDPRNLAIVFGPTLIRPLDDSIITMVRDMSDQCRITEMIIHHVSLCFACISVLVIHLFQGSSRMGTPFPFFFLYNWNVVLVVFFLYTPMEVLW